MTSNFPSKSMSTTFTAFATPEAIALLTDSEKLKLRTSGFPCVVLFLSTYTFPVPDKTTSIFPSPSKSPDAPELKLVSFSF